MEIAVLPTAQDIAREAADRVGALMNASPNAVLGLATGSSPVALYQELGRRHREEGLSFAQSRAFLLDEYVGLPLDHPEAYRNVIRREFTSLVAIPESEGNSSSARSHDLNRSVVEIDKSYT